MRVRTSSKQASLQPVHHHEKFRPQADALGKICASPRVHGPDAARETPAAAEIEDGRVPNVCQATQVVVFESLVTSVVHIAVSDLISAQTRGTESQPVEFVSEVDTLLVCALGGGGKRSKLAVDLLQELSKLAEVKSAGLVLVKRFEEFVKPLEMGHGLWEFPLDRVGDVAPLAEGELEGFRIFAMLESKPPKERYNVVCTIILYCRAVSNSIYVPKGGAIQSKMSIRLECVLVVLCGTKLCGNALTEI